MSTIISIHDPAPTAAMAAAISSSDMNGGFYSPAKAKAKAKAATRPLFSPRFPPFRRLRHLFCPRKLRLVASVFLLCFVVFLSSRLSSLMGWLPPQPNSSFPRGGGYTVLINTWKQSSALKQSVAHYATCDGVASIHVVWSDSDPPSETLKSRLENMVFSKSRAAQKPDFTFGMRQDEDLNNRFKSIEGIITDAVFSVDDDVIVSCDTLDFAFGVWQSAPNGMVGFTPRMHWIDEEKSGVANYEYGGWWSVWWMGTYSMLLPKAAFFHRKYLDLYTYDMTASIRDYVTRERNCEDIAMSLLVANATGAPPIWVKGKMYKLGSSGISGLKRHSKSRNKCLNDLISLFGRIPLVQTNVKAVDARFEWFW